MIVAYARISRATFPPAAWLAENYGWRMALAPSAVMVSLIALIVGALGVATAMHAHLQQRMDSIAIMKSLGATSGRIVRIYATQTLMLGMIGGLLGILIGTAVERVLPLLIARCRRAKGASRST